jgi:hypothetical protein
VEDMLAFLPPTPAAPGIEPSPFLAASAPLESTRPASPIHHHNHSAHQLIHHHHHPHQPHSPSPFSPHHPKNRTPKPHTAGKRRGAKTPLARLVLEKAVREKGREMATDFEKTRLALGSEGGRRTNAGAGTASVSGPSTSRTTLVDGIDGKGKERAGLSGAKSLSGSTRGPVPTGSRSNAPLKSSTRISPSGSSSSSSSSDKSMPTSAQSGTVPTDTGLGRSQRKTDLSKAEGMGPRGASKGPKIWR